jgi:hypothetical protein
MAVAPGPAPRGYHGGLLADLPLGDREVDRPGGTHEQPSRQASDAEDRRAKAECEDLSAGDEADRVAADKPGPMTSTEITALTSRATAKFGRRAAANPRTMVTSIAAPNTIRSGYSTSRASARGKNWLSHSADRATPTR